MDDKLLIASKDYIQRRHEIALRLLAECDKLVSSADVALENELRDQALLALVKREYRAAANFAQDLAFRQEQQDHILQRRQELVLEFDKLCEARKTLEQRQEMLEQAPATLPDPCVPAGSASGDPCHMKITAYLQSRSDVALQLIAVIDAKLDRLLDDPARSEEERERLTSQREKLRFQADEALAQIAEQDQGQVIMDSLGIPKQTAA